MSVISGFADISLLQLLLFACVALFAAVVGGLAGYGTGALMPLFLVPLIGAEPVVPIIPKSSVFGLAGVVTAQVLAFALLIGAIAIPGAFLARTFVERMQVHIHTAILDVAVIAGGLVIISAAMGH